MYAPGETLEPDCAPTAPNCGVIAPAASGANTDITSLGGLTSALSVLQGGTGVASYSVGDLLYALSTASLTTLPIGSDGDVLKVSGGKPVWGAGTSANIADTDLTLTGDRTLSLDGHSFTFNGTTGDVLFAYTTSMEAILWRPSTNKIINVAPISINSAQNLNQGTKKVSPDAATSTRR